MTNLFKKILCPVEFDENSVAALSCARDLAKASDGKLYVLHVVVVPGAGPNFPLEPYYPPASEEPHKHDVEKFAADNLGTSVAYEVITHRGDPAGIITRTADDVGADLIVMATHGRKGVSRIVLGSVTEHVVRESKQPVLTIRPDEAQRGYYEQSHTG